ncbi:gliding motility-associated C-terminal domain-containing protein [Mucilaginibacter sp. dw_454]|uniref:gliding motility-associated C-terminal domain-containing protein n=1 Tax=Mucilaginibacter sp. dw_454 TaxID=2720079 RepID=UPI001BD33B71|nr:gliding motility-associated C-terminal domain-containing protein [Mucilaginibacter sp. dw_454]
MKITSTFYRYCLLLFIFCASPFISRAQQIYATTQHTGATGLLCLNCTVSNAAAAADGNLQSFSTLNVSVGIAATTYQELIFPGSAVAANTPVSIKLGSGDHLLSLTALGGITVQAYNGSNAVGAALTASTLVNVASNNNEVEIKFAPSGAYDRVRVTLNGGLLGALSSIYLYEAFYFGPTAVPCNTAIDEIHGSSSAILGLGVNIGGVVNPLQSFDGNVTTFATLNAGVGVVGASTQQTLIYQSLSVIGDSVKVIMGVPSALLAASVLSNVSVTSFNGNVSNNDAQTVSSGLLNLQLLDLTNNVQRFSITYAPTKIFDRIQVALGGGIANVLSSLNVYEIERIIPKPVIKYNNVATSNVQLCAGSAATLTATAVPNTTFNWYTAATGGTAFFVGGSYTTPALNATTTYYVSASRAGCSEESARTPVTITVNQIPAAPAVINSAVTVCPGQPATFAATPVTGVTVNWYAAATGGTPIFTGNNFTTGALTANATYYAEAVAGGTCVSPTRTAVTATVSALPDVPTLTSPTTTICDGDVAVLSVTGVSGVTYNWYTAATGGTPIFTGVNFTTPVLHANTNYFVEAVNATGCNSTTRAQATVTVQPKPADPVLAANSLTITAGQSATISVTNSQTGIVYNWYTSATAATPVFAGVTYATPALYATTTYYVSATNSTGCQSANRTAITINVNINNNSPCTFANAQTNTTSGILCIGCSVENPALATDADTTTASTLHVPIGLLGGYVEQQLQFQQAGFAGDTVKLVFQSPVNLADVGLLGSISVTLYNGATPLTTYTLDNSLLTLRLLGSGNKYAVFIPATGAYDRVAIRLNSGVATLLNALQIYYAVQQYPKVIFANANPEICKGSPATLSITGPANGSFKWYDQPVNGTLLSSTTSYTTGPLNANTTYYVEYSRGTCVSPTRYPIQVLVNDPPVKPAVAPTTTAIFAGQTATFTATSVNNAVINWYDAATGGNLVHTGTTFTTPALSANTSYYAEAVTGTCPSPDRTKVDVTVTPVVIPDVTVTPPTQSINQGISASLTASSTTPSVKFNWYTQPTGGTSVFTGATFNSPNLFANTTYYAEAQVIATGAISATRASGIVTVNNPLVDPVHCDAAIDQTSATTGLLCLGCAVNNAAAAVDADRNTFSQISVPVSLLGNYAEQTLRFAGTGRAGDSVVVELGIPGSLLSAGVLSQISLATYNGATYNNDRFNVNGALLTINLLNGTNRFRVVFKAGADFDRVEIRLNAVVANVLSAVNVYDAYQEVAAPVIAVPAVTACAGTQVTLAATVPSYVTVKWYTSATGGTPVFAGTSFTTPVLSTTITYYAEASRTADGCVQGVRTPATVTVTPIPDAPIVAVPNVTVCSSQVASFTPQPVNGVTFNWYTAAVGGTPIFTGPTYTTAPLNATTSYYVEASGTGSCGSSTRTQVTATVTTTPVVPVVPAGPVQVCANSVTVLTATSPQPGVTFNWYTASTGGTPIFVGPQFTTPTLTANISYFVEAASGTCTSPTRAEIDVVVNPAPVAPLVTVTDAGGQITSGQVAHLTATSTTPGVVFNWYTSATGGSSFFVGPNYTTPILTSNTTYYVESALTATGCTSPTRTQITVIVNPVFSTSCDFASSQLNNVSGLCIGCTINNPNNAIDNDVSNFSQLSVPISVLGANVSQQLIFADQGIVGDTVTVKLELPVSLLSVGVLDQLQIQSYNGATANADQIALSSSLIRLQILPGGQSALVKFAPGATFDRVELKFSSTLASLFNTVNIYYASKQVAPPQLPNSTVNICANNVATFTLTNTHANVTYTWYDAAVGGNVVHTGTDYTTGPLTATTTFFVESSRTATGCVNPNRVAATVNVTPAPQNPTLTQNNLQICSGDNVILSVTNGAGATINWYDAPTGGTLLFTGNNYQVSPIANADYYVEFTNGTCTSSARTHATVQVNQRPSKPGTQSTNVQTCAGSPATLQVANAENGVTYNWYDAAVGGNLAFTGATVTTGNISQNTTYFVEAVNTTTLCVNNGGRTAVNVTISNQVNAPTLDATQTAVCSGGNVAISVVNPIAGLQYKWYADATGGAPVFIGTTYNILNITANVSYYVEAVNSTGCVSDTRTRTDITVNPVPPPPTVSSPSGGLSVCEGSAATLTISNPQADQVYRWFDAPVNGTLLYVGTQFVTPALTTTTKYYVQASDAGMCSSSTLAEVTVTINAIPADPTVNSNNPVVCYGKAATLSITSPVAGVVYNWYDSPARANLLFVGTTYVTDPITTTTNYYVASANTAGCTSGNLVQIQVTTEDLPQTPIIANGASVSTCTGSTVTLTIGNPQPGYTYNWYSVSAGGTALGTGNSFTVNNVNSSIIYYAEAVNATGCSNSTRASVSVTVVPPPGAPQLAANNVSVCPGTAATLSVTNNDPNISIKWYSDAAATNLLVAGNSFTTPALNADATYYAQATNSTGCISAVTTATVTITQPLVAPIVTVGTTTASSVTFQWNAITDAVEYQVSLDKGATFTSVGTASSYTASGLQPNQSVTIIVRAVSLCQPGVNSQAVTGKSSNPFGDGIFVPNAFTPNGDGKNDILYVYGTNIKSVSLWIYDQWGELQFKSATQGSGWDGTYKGTAQPVGVYVYYVEATMNDGQLITKKGTVTLIR